MKKIAIDVVLLPDEKVTTLSKSMNKQLRVEYPSGPIVLGKGKCVPHISLAMGVIEEKNLGNISKILTDIAYNALPMNMVIENFSSKTISSGEPVFDAKIKATEEIINLNQTIMEKLWDYMTYEVDSKMLYNPDEIDEQTFYWIEKFKDNYRNPDKFNPHITLGFGEGRNIQVDTPIGFRVNKIGIFQLGNFCTCSRSLLNIVTEIV